MVMIQISWAALSWTCTSILYLVLLSVALSLLYSTLYYTVHMSIPWLCSPYFDIYQGLSPSPRRKTANMYKFQDNYRLRQIKSKCE